MLGRVFWLNEADGHYDTRLSTGRKNVCAMDWRQKHSQDRWPLLEKIACCPEQTVLLSVSTCLLQDFFNHHKQPACGFPLDKIKLKTECGKQNELLTETTSSLDPKQIVYKILMYCEARCVFSVARAHGHKQTHTQKKCCETLCWAWKVDSILH